MSSQGLPVNRLISVALDFSTQGAQFANFDSLLIMGDSNVIDTHERIRGYDASELSQIAADFGTNAPEYLASIAFFGQTPQPESILIGRWAQGATSGKLVCGALTATQQLIATWNAVIDGGFKIQIDGGAATEVPNLNFSAAANLNAVAADIQAAMIGAGLAATCIWNGSQFVFTSNSTGAASTVSALTAAAGGDTDISAMLKGTAGTLSYIVGGIVAESALAAVTILDGLSTPWYGLTIASTHVVDADYLAIAAYIEADGKKHIFGITTSEAAALITPDTTSIGAQLHALGYKRSFYQYSSTNPYAIASLIGRQFTVDFNGNNTVITLAYKQEPGVTPETLTSAQANALDANNYNYFVNFNNGTAIIVNGKMAGDFYIDEIVGTDWYVNQVQTDVYNLLYTSPTKIPQTDAGNHQIATAIEGASIAAVNNGLLGQNLTWNSAGFGQLKQGDLLPKGFYVYTPPITSQAQADREARKSVTFQVAAKLAGAIQDVDILITANR